MRVLEFIDGRTAAAFHLGLHWASSIDSEKDHEYIVDKNIIEQVCTDQNSDLRSGADSGPACHQLVWTTVNSAALQYQASEEGVTTGAGSQGNGCNSYI